MENGIAVAGNLLVDKIKMISAYPTEGNLSHIISENLAVGGCVPNTLIDIAKLDPSIPLCAIGKVGNDEEGKYVKCTLKKYDIDISRVTNCDIHTSYTDVMTVSSTGNRTFFQMKGANSEFDINDLDVTKIKADILHLGYALLLDRFDAPDSEYGTVMARALHDAKNHGLKTSIDVISEQSNRFAEIIKPALKYCSYIILNEIESGEIVGIPARNESGKLIFDNIEKILLKLIELGVEEYAVVHCPEAGFMMHNGVYSVMPSLNLPHHFIKGTVGAGDAFCAATLLGIYHGYDDDSILRIASAAAAANLSAVDSVSGVGTMAEVMNYEYKFGRKKL